MPFDVRDELRRGFPQRQHVEHQNAHLPGDQQVADLVGRGNVPQPPRPAHGLSKRLQEGLVGGEHHELDDLARQAESQRIQRAAFFVRG